MAGKSIALGALILILATAGALAADPPAPTEKQRLICRGAESRLGSHIRRPQRCRTAEQWQEEEDARGRRPLSLQITAGQNDGRQTAAPR